MVLPPPGFGAAGELSPERALGAKAGGLLDLHALRLPVPEALIVPASYGRAYRTAGPDGRSALLCRVVSAATDFVEQLNAPTPLVSFRCAAKSGSGGQPMPESVLNVGASPTTLEALAARGWGSAVLAQLDAGFREHAEKFYAFFGDDLPPGFLTARQRDQFAMLFARVYEGAEGSDPDAGPIVVQRMIFGNLTAQSLTGMCYTRHPHTGELVDYGRFILGRQGMSLGGTSSPDQLDLPLMAIHNPTAYATLKRVCRQLEAYYGDIRALEYTAEGEQLFILQNTIGSRTFRLGPAGGRR